MNYINIKMKQIQYDGHDYTSYFLHFHDVNKILQEGSIPQITLPEENIENKPVVATILAQWKNPKYKEKDYFLTPFYINAIQNAGGYPVFIAFDKIKEQLDNFNPDAILLVGGDFDIPKDWYVNLNKEVKDFHRHNAYQTMISYAEKHKLPTLGICGGMQALAGYLGAKIKTDINSDKNIQINHRPGGASLIHTIHINEKSQLYNAVKENDFMVTSVHHEAVVNNRLGDSKIVAIAPDNTVEAIEPKNPWSNFVIGVQWHPERWATMNNKPSVNLFKSFIESINQK